MGKRNTRVGIGLVAGDRAIDDAVAARLAAEGYGVEHFASIDALLGRMRAPADGPPLGVITIAAHARWSTAAIRELHTLDPMLRIVFTATAEERPTFERELRYLPVEQLDWMIAPSGDPVAIAGAIDRSARSYQQRRGLRTTLDRMNVRLQSRRALDSSDVRRLVISDRYLASVLAHARDAIISCDNAGRIVTWNTAAETLFGYGAREVVGRALSTLVPESGHGFLRERLGAAVTSGGYEEMVFLRKDGSTIDTSASMAPILDESGERLGSVVIARDITEQRATEAQRARLLAREQELRREAQENNRLKDEFLVTLSHELRTPLTAIVGWSALLSDPTIDDETRAHAVEAIQRNARAQTQLIEDILDVSRIIAGKLTLEVAELRLESVIDAALDAVRPAADGRGIRLSKLLDTTIGTVHGDAARLQQVLWNLLTNAIKFTPKGGRVQIRLDRRSSVARISVCDTGIGIEPAFIPFVFDRFRQADGSITRSSGGLGLGLALVRQVVEMHGGTVEARSDGLGKGSEFVVELPLMSVQSLSEPAAASHEAETPAPPQVIARLEGISVLVVDDEHEARTMLRTVLSSAGARVRDADSADAARAELKRRRPDIIVSDVGMPGESGYDLVRYLRSLAPEAGGLIPAIALTAYARTEDRIRALQAGFNVHLTKPVVPAELTAVVAGLVGTSDRRQSPG